MPTFDVNKQVALDATGATGWDFIMPFDAVLSGSHFINVDGCMSVTLAVKSTSLPQNLNLWAGDAEEDEGIEAPVGLYMMKGEVLRVYIRGDASDKCRIQMRWRQVHG